MEIEMTISFENDRMFLCMSQSEQVLCRVRTDATDLGKRESLSQFVLRHGGIDLTLKYLRSLKK